MSTSSSYVLGGYNLEKLEFWWWYAWAVRTGWQYPFRQALRMWRLYRYPPCQRWPIDL
ncbi:MAG TPA: hypothetical protein VND65_22220 [Candidatus Binatia bacterium]|nr:hypothetical protein [Candidatus Binatia bacterium]